LKPPATFSHLSTIDWTVCSLALKFVSRGKNSFVKGCSDFKNGVITSIYLDLGIWWKNFLRYLASWPRSNLILRKNKSKGCYLINKRTTVRCLFFLFITGSRKELIPPGGFSIRKISPPGGPRAAWGNANPKSLTTICFIYGEGTITEFADD